jgi:hypothetical protein
MRSGRPQPTLSAGASRKRCSHLVRGGGQERDKRLLYQVPLSSVSSIIPSKQPCPRPRQSLDIGASLVRLCRPSAESAIAWFNISSSTERLSLYWSDIPSALLHRRRTAGLGGAQTLSQNDHHGGDLDGAARAQCHYRESRVEGLCPVRIPNLSMADI